MERMTYVKTIPMSKPARRFPVNEIPEVEVCIPGRGATGMIRIGSIIEQVQQIINHPDRNRLMAELFKDYKRDNR